MQNWFVDKKLSVHFGEEKTKCIIFSREKNLAELNLTYNNKIIKRYCMVEYHSCSLDASLARESMSMQSHRKVSTKLQFQIHKMSF